MKIIAPSGKEVKAITLNMGDSLSDNVNLAEKGMRTIKATVKIGDKKILVNTHYETK